jgi:hypothetical protein
MFLRNRGQAWERTNKNDANHDLVRDKLGQPRVRSTRMPESTHAI